MRWSSLQHYAQSLCEVGWCLPGKMCMSKELVQRDFNPAFRTRLQCILAEADMFKTPRAQNSIREWYLFRGNCIIERAGGSKTASLILVQVKGCNYHSTLDWTCYKLHIWFLLCAHSATLLPQKRGQKWAEFNIKHCYHLTAFSTVLLSVSNPRNLKQDERTSAARTLDCFVQCGEMCWLRALIREETEMALEGHASTINQSTTT